MLISLGIFNQYNTINGTICFVLLGLVQILDAWDSSK